LSKAQTRSKGPAWTCHREGDLDAEARRLTPRPRDRRGGEVAASHLMALEGQADRLGADAAGRVQDALGTGPREPRDQAGQHVALAAHLGLPVLEDQVVVRGEVLVEADHLPRIAAHVFALEKRE
jgi:hypothetical protein